MRDNKYPIGALVGMIGALACLGTAAGAPLSQTLKTTLAPKKQSKKTFGGVSLRLIIGTTVDNPAMTQSPQQMVFTIDRNVKFDNGKIPACELSEIQGKFTAQAQAACPRSITGGGSVEVNDGALTGNVTSFSGGPSTIYLQTDIGPGATSLTMIGTISGETVTFGNIPNTPGLVLTELDTTFNRRQTGRKTFYVMARCKKKRWTTTETTTFYSGESLSASSTQRCKRSG